MTALLLALFFTFGFPAIVVFGETRDGKWRPRGGDGKYISKREGILRFIPPAAIFWIMLILFA